LGYGAPVTVTGAGSGVITWLPAPGTVIGRGQPVYRADNRPVPLFYGRLPLYRPLQTGGTGADVTEGERNLAALGYTGGTVDKYYTAATAAAVWAWQHDNGLTPTGVLTPAEVVLAPGKLRVASLAAHLGDPATGPALTYTGTRRVVQVALDVALQRLARRGPAAPGTLRAGTTVGGRSAARDASGWPTAARSAAGSPRSARWPRPASRRPTRPPSR